MTALAVLEIFLDAAVRVKGFQTNDPYAVMVAATSHGCGAVLADAVDLDKQR